MNTIYFKINEKNNNGFFEITSDFSFINNKEIKFNFYARSLNEIYKSILDISKSNKLFKDTHFYIDNVFFLKINDINELEINTLFPQNIANKYAESKNISFFCEFKENIYHDLNFEKGFIIIRTDDITYTNDLSENHLIKSKEKRNTWHFKNKQKALESLKYYLYEDKNNNLSLFDKIKVMINDKEYKTLLMGKEYKENN